MPRRRIAGTETMALTITATTIPARIPNHGEIPNFTARIPLVYAPNPKKAMWAKLNTPA